MPLPVHVPLIGRKASPAERIAAIADLLEAAAQPPRAFALAVRIGDFGRAHVVVVLPDGGREALSPDDARLLARVLAEGAAWPGAKAAAVALSAEAMSAELRAGVMMFARSLGRGLAPLLKPEGAA